MRHLAALVFVCAQVLSEAAPSALESRPAPSARLRPVQPRAANLLKDAIRRSTTVRSLAEALERSSIIVYIELALFSRPDVDGHLRFMAAAGDYRYVRISLNAHNCQQALISVLGHELQHALEIADAPEVTDEASLRTFYKRIGVPGATEDRFDTSAARDVGRRVEAELGRASSRLSADRPAFPQPAFP